MGAAQGGLKNAHGGDGKEEGVGPSQENPNAKRAADTMRARGQRREMLVGGACASPPRAVQGGPIVEGRHTPAVARLQRIIFRQCAPLLRRWSDTRPRRRKHASIGAPTLRWSARCVSLSSAKGVKPFFCRRCVFPPAVSLFSSCPSCAHLFTKRPEHTSCCGAPSSLQCGAAGWQHRCHFVFLPHVLQGAACCDAARSPQGVLWRWLLRATQNQPWSSSRDRRSRCRAMRRGVGVFGRLK
jgi:hypothetical protein